MKFKQLTAAFISALLFMGCGSAASTKPQETAETESTPASETVNPNLARVEAIIESMSLRDKLEQLMVITIQDYHGEHFTEMNDEVSSFLEEHSFGGFIVFGANSENPSQTATLINEIQTHGTVKNGIGLIMAMDQEGGYMTRLAGGTITPGNMALGASGKTSLAKASAEILGSELSLAGINTDFAPVADINSEPANPVIGIRSFSDDPILTSSMVSAFIEGLQEESMIACAKHFPGHGNTTVDSHTGLPVLNSTKEELEQKELIPFYEAAKKPVDMIMTSHICFPQIEQDTYTSILDGQEITLPATLSDDIVQGILRNDMGYDGVVITDSLLMDAIKENFSLTDATALAWNAGVDLILMPVNLSDSASLAVMDEYLSAIEQRVGQDISEERINEALKRVLLLKADHELLSWTPKDSDALAQAASEGIGKIENAESERAIADQCVTVVKNENDVLPLTGAGKVVLAAPQGSQLNGFRYGYEQLIGTLNLVYQPVYVNYSYGREINTLLNEINGASAVVISSWLDNMSQFDESESIMIPSVKQVITACHEQGIPCIVISTGLPYDLSCYDDADALLAVYNPYGAQADETNEIIAPCAPNIPAGLDIIFGYARPSAVLPVNVPRVEGASFLDEIAYPIGTGLTW